MGTEGKSWAGSLGTIAKESQTVLWSRKEEIQPASTSQICKEWKFLRSVMKSLREIHVEQGQDQQTGVWEVIGLWRVQIEFSVTKSGSDKQSRVLSNQASRRSGVGWKGNQTYTDRVEREWEK